MGGALGAGGNHFLSASCGRAPLQVEKDQAKTRVGAQAGLICRLVVDTESPPASGRAGAKRDSPSCCSISATYSAGPAGVSSCWSSDSRPGRADGRQVGTTQDSPGARGARPRARDRRRMGVPFACRQRPETWAPRSELRPDAGPDLPQAPRISQDEGVRQKSPAGGLANKTDPEAKGQGSPGSDRETPGVHCERTKKEARAPDGTEQARVGTPRWQDLGDESAPTKAASADATDAGTNLRAKDGWVRTGRGNRTRRTARAGAPGRLATNTGRLAVPLGAAAIDAPISTCPEAASANAKAMLAERASIPASFQGRITRWQAFFGSRQVFLCPKLGRYFAAGGRPGRSGDSLVQQNLHDPQLEPRDAVGLLNGRSDPCESGETPGAIRG